MRGPFRKPVMLRPVRDFEWELLKPYLFNGTKILELGNKKNSVGVYKPYFEACGFVHTSVDINGLDGALSLDLRMPIIPELAARGLPTEYDVLTNSGVTEHVVDNQAAVWRNCFELIGIGGVQIHITPAANHWMNHGLLHPKEEFYTRMAKLNDMTVLFIDEYRWTPGKVLTRAVLRKEAAGDFQYPGDELLCRTPKYEAYLRGEPVKL